MFLRHWGELVLWVSELSRLVERRTFLYIFLPFIEKSIRIYIYINLFSTGRCPVGHWNGQEES